MTLANRFGLPSLLFTRLAQVQVHVQQQIFGALFSPPSFLLISLKYKFLFLAKSGILLYCINSCRFCYC